MSKPRFIWFSPLLLSVLPALQHVVVTGIYDLALCLLAVLTIFSVAVGFKLALQRCTQLDTIRVIILVDLAILAFAFFGSIHDNAEAFLRGTVFFPYVRLWLTLAILGMLYLLLAVGVARTRKPLDGVYQTLNLTALLVVVFASVPFLSRAQAMQKVKASAQPMFQISQIPKRDFFYIVLDSYTSFESLKRYWKYDNSEFSSYLTNKGFTVMEGAKSDYASTPLCILSTFNLDRLPFERSAHHHALLFGENSLINQSLVGRVFQETGFELVNLSLFDLADTRKAYQFSQQRYNAYVTSFRETVAGRWHRARENRRMAFDIGVTNLALLSQLASFKPATNGSPNRFVYAHIMMPHAPFHFSADGSRRPEANAPEDQHNKDAYLGQLIYTTSLIRQTIDSLLANYDVKPVIILQGDHGFRSLFNSEAEKEAHTILNAYYLPDVPDLAIPPGITPVSTFRLIFNHYFGANYPLIPASQN